jgi:hypothetical protein
VTGAKADSAAAGDLARSGKCASAITRKVGKAGKPLRAGEADGLRELCE